MRDSDGVGTINRLVSAAPAAAHPLELQCAELGPTTERSEEMPAPDGSGTAPCWSFCKFATSPGFRIPLPPTEYPRRRSAT